MKRERIFNSESTCSSFVNPKIAEHRGRVVKNTGDGLLAEFGSAVDAVRCAMDVQRGMAKRNAEVPQETRIDFRIGINIGDIILDRGDIFGDCVNVAARLEGVADPGDICMSDDVVKQVQGRVAGDFVYVGEHELKNIARAVRVYRVALDGAIAKRASSLPYMPPTAVGHAQSAEGPPSKGAGKAGPADRRSGGARLLLGYAMVAILTLLLAHYLFVMKLDLNTYYLRVFAQAFPALVGLALVWHSGRSLGATVLLGVTIGIISAWDACHRRPGRFHSHLALLAVRMAGSDRIRRRHCPLDGGWRSARPLHQCGAGCHARPLSRSTLSEDQRWRVSLQPSGGR
jgi:hypothetical protein